MAAYYNEHDAPTAAWLRELIKAKLITDGVVDERSIVDVEPADVVGFSRVHFFAGIAGWDHALNLAGWGDRPVWTGSCPCQPFSAAGKGDGEDDPEGGRAVRPILDPTYHKGVSTEKVSPVATYAPPMSWCSWEPVRPSELDECWPVEPVPTDWRRSLTTRHKDAASEPEGMAFPRPGRGARVPPKGRFL